MRGFPFLTRAASGRATVLTHCPLSRDHRRRVSSKPKVASRRAAGEMKPPVMLSV